MTSDEDVKVYSDRPYSWTDSFGNTYRYYKDPIKKVCGFILIQEACERLAFYGVQNNLKKLLRENYKMSEPACNSFLLVSNGLIYCSSLISAIMSDSFLGTYNTILAFSVIYMCGLVLIVIAALPDVGLLWMVYLSQFGLFAIGAGGIKSCVSVLGGQQFSPVDQKEQLASFFTFFYGSINVGALIGGIVIPIMIQNTTIAYAFIMPVGCFALATAVLIFGSKRYVRIQPQGSSVLQISKVMIDSIGAMSLAKCKKSNGGKFDDHFIDDAKVFFSLVPVFLLAIPFHNAYDQIFTLFETQSETMNINTFGWDMPAQMMSNMDPLAVIIGAYVLDTWIFPALRARDKMPTVMQRFFIGYILAALSNGCALLVELAIQNNTPESVTIWAQTAQFSLVAWGEIFVISTTYEVAYTFSPEPLKTCASAFNLTAIALASYIKLGIIQACKPWMESNRYDYLYYVMTAICVVFAVVSFFCNKHFEGVFARAELHNRTVASRRNYSRADDLELTAIDIVEERTS